MLSDLTLLLHEMGDSLRSRVPIRHPRSGRAAAGRVAAPHDAAAPVAAILVTGLASPGKTRFVDALRLRGLRLEIVVQVDAARPSSSFDVLLHVHAETDLEGMVEGGLQAVTQKASRAADLLVPVDWERVERSVDRVVEALIARGLGIEARGA